jgi:imidazole glycerol phosphate synthase glutamine amidotransferase subunit
MSVIVVPTGTANIASMLAGLRRLGENPLVARSVDDVDGAERVVLPGVGSFGAAMETLDDAGLGPLLRERIDQGRPTLAVCVGMQLLAPTSEESDGVSGLGVVDQAVRRFPETVRVPQLGWNEVAADPDSRFLANGWAYFANSYRFESVPPGWTPAFSDHGGRFVAAMERGDVLACQFHPELSGEWGSQVLGRWLGRAA